MFNFFRKKEDTKEPLAEEEKLIAIPEPSCEFDCAITYYIKKDGEVCLDIDLDDYEPENLKNLAKLVAIIGTDECYVETLNMLKDGFTAEGRPDLFNEVIIFVASNLPLEKAVESISQLKGEGPCIKPSDMI